MHHNLASHIPVESTENEPSVDSVESVIGQRIRALRTQKKLSLRALSSASGLNINTLSLIENGKTSPSVSTLQQLAQAMKVPLVAFFENEPAPRPIVFTGAGQRPCAEMGTAQLQNLGEGLSSGALQPFVVTLPPAASSGDQAVIHTGYEWVYCLSGKIEYQIEEKEYELNPGDSLVFEAHLPHRWRNGHPQESQFLLVFSTTDAHEEPQDRHFIHG